MEQIDAAGRGTTLIHFVFAVDPERIACMPNMTEFHATAYHPNYQRTDDPRAATCPACRRTDAYRRAGAAAGMPLPVAHFPENAAASKEV